MFADLFRFSLPPDAIRMMALNFSASLDTVFAIQEPITPEIVDLAQSVEQKKQAVDSQSRELQALEARLREMEERLKMTSPSSTTTQTAETTSNDVRRQTQIKRGSRITGADVRGGGERDIANENPDVEEVDRTRGRDA